jgi:hypothetical protein
MNHARTTDQLHDLIDRAHDGAITHADATADLAAAQHFAREQEAAALTNAEHADVADHYRAAADALDAIMAARFCGPATRAAYQAHRNREAGR